MSDSGRKAWDRPLLTGLLVAGLGALVISLAWWGIVFRTVVGAGYLGPSDAVRCLAGTSSLCELAMSLCTNSHPFGIRRYEPELLWLALATLSASALLFGRARATIER